MRREEETSGEEAAITLVPTLNFAVAQMEEEPAEAPNGMRRGGSASVKAISGRGPQRQPR